MAERIVILGWSGDAIELLDANDAGALVNSGLCRVSLAMWSGPLKDATVLMLGYEWLQKHGGENEDGYNAAWRTIRKLVRESARRDLVLDVPIPVGAISS